jgi:hypothetical protein
VAIRFGRWALDEGESLGEAAAQLGVSRATLDFYGNRSRRGAKVAAILYSLIATAKLRGIDPAEYLRKAARAAIRQSGSVVLPD